jgi:hypothetical protein
VNLDMIKFTTYANLDVNYRFPIVMNLHLNFMNNLFIENQSFISVAQITIVSL